MHHGTDTQRPYAWSAPLRIFPEHPSARSLVTALETFTGSPPGCIGPDTIHITGSPSHRLPEAMGLYLIIHQNCLDPGGAKLNT